MPGPVLITGNTVENKINQIKGCPDLLFPCLAASLGSGGRAVKPVTVRTGDSQDQPHDAAATSLHELSFAPLRGSGGLCSALAFSGSGADGEASIRNGTGRRGRE